MALYCFLCSAKTRLTGVEIDEDLLLISFIFKTGERGVSVARIRPRKMQTAVASKQGADEIKIEWVGKTKCIYAYGSLTRSHSRKEDR